MFQGCGAVATLGLNDLVWLPLVLNGEHSKFLALVGEQNLLPDRDVLTVGVHHDRQSEEIPRGGAVPGHHGVVIGLVHETPFRGEATDHQQLNVTGIAIGAFDAAAG